MVLLYGAGAALAGALVLGSGAVVIWQRRRTSQE
jgi:hypothetical protein